MLLLLALIGLFATEPDPPASADPTANNDIVVVAERMKKISVATQVDKDGARHCIIRQSSGDPAFDQAFCSAVLTCALSQTKPKGMDKCMRREMDAITAQFTKPKEPPEP